MTTYRDESNADVVFVIDRVMHYHAVTLRSVERVLEKRGIRFAVLSAQDTREAVGRVAIRESVVNLHRRFRLTEKLVGGFQLRFQRDLVALLRTLQPRVLVSTCHSGTVSEWQALKWARRHGARTVAWQCGYEYNPGRVKRFVLGRFVPQFDFHLCYHTNAKHYAMQHGAAEEQTLVMHNTIDERAIVAGDADAARAALAQKHPELLGKKLVLYVGAVLEEKRLEQVFEALDRLARADTMFVLVGDGPHLAALKGRYAQRSDWLSTGSIVQGVGVYFDAAHAFVLPGTGGLAINEAMAHRVPVISGYADGSADDLVVDGVTGYRLRDDTPDELAEKLKRLLDDPATAQAMGLAGEQRIRGHLSFERFIDRVTGVLLAQHALAAGGAHRPLP